MTILRITNPFGYNDHISLYFFENNNPTIQEIINKSYLKDINLYSNRLNSIKKINPLPIDKTLSELNISIVSLDSGFGPEELPDWGGRHFRLLKKPWSKIKG